MGKKPSHAAVPLNQKSAARGGLFKRKVPGKIILTIWKDDQPNKTQRNWQVLGNSVTALYTVYAVCMSLYGKFVVNFYTFYSTLKKPRE
jgi:hypothetical protein